MADTPVAVTESNTAAFKSGNQTIVVSPLSPVEVTAVAEAEAEAKTVFAFLRRIGVPDKVAYGVTAVAVAVSAVLAAHYGFQLF